MELLYKVKDRPSFGKIIIFALQQLLSILAGTVTLPLIVGNGLSQSAALFGACVGTFIYLLITKFKSPVFLGSSFTFLGSMSSAFAGAATAAIGFTGILLGAVLAGSVYVILSIIVRFTGTNWVDKIMPPVIIGPTVALIALTLAPNAVNNFFLGDVLTSNGTISANPYICFLCAMFALVTVVISAIYGKSILRLVPFIVGILAGYSLAFILTLFGQAYNNPAIQIINFAPFNNIEWLPDFAFLKAIQGFKDFGKSQDFSSYFGLIAASYIPVAVAVFAEHIADHKNISHIIETDLLKEPGLSRTLMGDGLGSMIGAFFGGCPNTTYGESISCIAFSKNASIVTIIATCIIGIAISFFGPLMTFFETIPTCVVGGISVALYGFIALSGLQMLKKVDLHQQKNIFVISTILIFGIGGITLNFYYFQLSPIACAFIAGVIMNLIVNIRFKKKKEVPPQEEKDNKHK